MSSGLRLIADPRLAFTCHAINPIEKTMPTPAAIQALVVEFTAKFSFQKGRIELPTSVGSFSQGVDGESPTRVGTLNTVIHTTPSAPIPAARRPSMMDEQRPQGNRLRRFAVVRQSAARLFLSSSRARREYRPRAPQYDEFPAPVCRETSRSASPPKLVQAIQCSTRPAKASRRVPFAPRPLQSRRNPAQSLPPPPPPLPP